MQRVLFLLAWVLIQVGRQAVGVPSAHGADARSPSSPTEHARRFETEIAPLLVQRCVECHGPRAKKGRLDLSRKATALAGGESGKAIVPGNATDSLLWQYVDANEMPKGRTPLSSAEKQLLREWIDAGAAWSLDVLGAAPLPSGGRIGDEVLRRLTVPEYIETVRSAVGVEIEQEARRFLPPDLRADGFRNTAYSLGVDLAHVEAYARLAEVIVERMEPAKFAAQFSPRRELNDAALRDLIAKMGKRLLRGPLQEHEIAAFLRVGRTVAEQGGDFDEAVRYLVEAMLQSPRFIYRIENQVGGDPASRPDDYALASRLSFILWGGPPDQELMRAADAGELADLRSVETQVQRMLQDPRAVQRSLQFISEWLDLERLSSLRPQPQRFPTWNGLLAADMREETLAFFKYVAWEQKRPLAELLNARVTFATPRLARHYGLDVSPAGVQHPAEAQRSAAAPRRPERVVAGLQTLYAFDELDGDTVHDSADAGEPLHLKIGDASAVRWSERGLSINGPTLIAAATAPKRMIDAVKKSRAITLEAWITSAKETQTGPARILTLSSDPNGRNFTLGQDGDRVDVRLRTTRTNANGQPSLAGPSGSVGQGPTHVVFTRDSAGKARLYIDGSEGATRDFGGDLSSWDGGFRLALANELTRDRPWLGILHLAAIYDRALSAGEVRQNHAAGPRPHAQSQPPLPAEAARFVERGEDLLVLYRFDEGSGDRVRDTSETGQPLHLKIENPAAVRWERGGLTVYAPTIISAAASPKKLSDALRRSKAITLEAWVTPAKAQQTGPARILTWSSGILQRNVTLGQEADKYDVRFRGSASDANGLPSLSSPGGAAVPRPTHLVYTRDAAGKARLFIDGEEKGARDAPGDLTNWDEGFRLALANETSQDRPWLGTYHRIAIYGRALSAEEVRANLQPRSQESEFARYDLSESTRGGLLTQGSVLTIGGDEASMVTRGLFVLNELLYSGVEDPPPCIDTTPVPTRPGLTQRAIAESRIANQACGGCHAKFEPLAFGLERFDGVGAYREVDEHGNKLREDGEILFPGQDEPVAYKTSAELMDRLAGSDRVRRAITRKVTQFAIGRPLSVADEPILNRIHQSSQAGGGTYTSLITAIVLSELVLTARAETPRVAVARPETRPPAPANAPQRVMQGLQALYTFQEGRGDTVRDRSGVGQPLHLKIADPVAVEWTGAGLTVKAATLIASEKPPKRLIDALQKSRSVTLEAWVGPADARQSGPARILTLSSGTGERNFTLGQDGDKFDVRFRTARTDKNGLPSLASPAGSVRTRLTHVVYTRDAAGKARLYLDGQVAGSRDVGGDLGNWSDAFRLALANETTRDRAWRGALRLVALYDRALTSEEVRRNHAAGYSWMDLSWRKPHEEPTHQPAHGAQRAGDRRHRIAAVGGNAHFHGDGPASGRTGAGV